MKIIYIILVFLNISIAFTNEIKISVNPQEPILGESFNVTFKIITKEGKDPNISFNPSSGLEVTGRQESGISTSTTYINGNLSVERSISITYEMIANKAGSLFLRDINVEVNGIISKHSNFRINVLSERETPKDILAVAEVDKTSAYVGESILVRYYLYNKVTINSTDIKTFPKLDKFLKRYHQEKMTAERVNYEGSIYTRRVLYTAQLFADKPGSYKIDPITLTVQYLQESSGGGSLGYGFGFRQQRSVSVMSKSIPVEIKSLPSDGVPAHFTGLVGKHDFKLIQNKQKFLVNDPIELKLTVKGPGALELYEAPKLLSSDVVEEFESSADLSVGNDFNATKVFDITLLGRSALELPATRIPISYFEPNTATYQTEYLDLQTISIVGQNVTIQGKGNEVPISKNDQSLNQIIKSEKIDLTPLYSLTNTYIINSKQINTILLILVVLLIISGGVFHYRKLKDKVPAFFEKIEKEGLDYGTLIMVLSKIGNEVSFSETITKSNLSNSSKSELTNILRKCEDEYFKMGKSQKHKISKKTLKELIENFENISYEDL
jgi:hypothetical protein